MNINELMIGDWVKVYGSEQFGIIQVIDDMNYECAVSGRYVSLCEIFPIPLTIDILKKNKFIEDIYIRTKDKFYRHEPNGFRLKVNIDSDGNFYVFDNITIQCNYVHQLQHAMRISGIEDEFVL